MRKILALAAVCAVALLTGPVAKAGVIFSTNGTETPTFFPANGSTSVSSIFHAFQFTVAAGAGGPVGQLVTAGLFDTPFTETFEILSDSSGRLGSVLDTFSVAGKGDEVGRLYTANSTTHVTLVAGTSYWLEALSPSGQNAFLWLQANPIVTSREYSSVTGYFNDQPNSAFALLTASQQPVPEPATLYLAAIGFAGLSIARRRRQRWCRG